MYRIKRNPTKIVNGQVRRNTPYRKGGQAYRLLQDYAKKEVVEPSREVEYEYYKTLSIIDKLKYLQQ